MMAPRELETIELTGNSAEMGCCHGEHFRGPIRELAELRMGHLAKFVARYDPSRNVGPDEILAAARRTFDAHRRFDPSSWSELEGIAHGADIPVEELLVSNGYTDLRDFVAFAGAGAAGCEGHLGECSAFLVCGERAAGGAPLVGQTWDLHADGAPYVILVRRRPSDAPATVGITTTGCLCLIGCNSEGVAVGNTNLIPRDVRVGVNYLFTITAALRCRSAGEAADLVEGAPRLSGHNFLVADGREAINVETTARRCCRTAVTGEEVFVHTNHYLDGELAGLEVPRELSGTRFRRDRLRENFAGVSGAISMDDCWRQLADDTRQDGAAVCNEDYEGRFGAVATLATIVQCPGQGRICACAGGARGGRRVEVQV